MKAHLTALMALLLLGATAFAQEEEPPFFKQFSVEIATGLPPIHTLLEVNGTKYDKSLAQQGKQPDMDGAWMPALSVSAVWKTAPRWEMVLTGGVSWCHHKVIQYGTFGIDPQGKPRYDLTKETPVGGWVDSSPVASLTVQERVFWNPRWKVQMYSAFGLGLTTSSNLVPIPSLMPVCIRLGGRHLYCYAETGFSPFASYLHGGLGFKF